LPVGEFRLEILARREEEEEEEEEMLFCGEGSIWIAESEGEEEWPEVYAKMAEERELPRANKRRA
jgi:hypothetical protein